MSHLPGLGVHMERRKHFSTTNQSIPEWGCHSDATATVADGFAFEQREGRKIKKKKKKKRANEHKLGKMKDDKFSL